MAKNEPLNSADFDLMKEIWTVSALDGIRGSLYGKELEAAMHEVRVMNALVHDRESINVGEERIRAIIDGDGPMTHNEHLVQGFDRAMMTVIRDRDRLDFDERSMVSLHRTLFSGVMCEKGRFRDGMDDAMVELFEDYRSQKTEVLAFLPRLMDDFLRTAPFRDGNKRMRALLACLILLKNGYTAQIYVGMDWEGPMLPSLTASYKELDRRYPLVENRKVKKRDRIYHIIETSPSPVKKRDICACIPDVSIRTADVVLSDLINQNRVEKLGSFKDAKYIPAGY